MCSFHGRRFLPVLLTAIITVLTFTGAPEAILRQMPAIVSTVHAEEFSYPLKSFDDGQARFYKYKTADGITVRYFILKSSDGVIRAAFDACDVCWREGKGYSQKGDFMICNNCGRRFHSRKVGEVSGGCNPAPLVQKVQDGKVVIDSQNLLQGRRYFDFKSKRG